MTPPNHARGVVLVALLVSLTGCVCAGNVTGNFVCVNQAQCADGYTCVAGRCRVAKTNACPTVSCELAACDGLACGDTRYCQGGRCACVEAGGAPETTESLCDDGNDNDCDGQFDCADPNCASRAACDGGVGDSGIVDAGPFDAGLADAGMSDSGMSDSGMSDSGMSDSGMSDSGVADSGVADSGVADSGTRDAGAADAGPGVSETACANGQDDDGDSLTDCEDPDCENHSCAGLGVPVCCSGACVNVASDKAHCGGCGAACSSGQLCNTIVVGGHSTGTCSCGTGTCPLNQQCLAFSCTCTSSTMCSSDGVCDNSSGAGYCRLP